MKTLLFILIMLFTSLLNASEPQRVNDWTLSSPFAYGFTKGLTLGLYNAKKPVLVIKHTPSVAEMPLGLVAYVEQHNRFSVGLGTFIGALLSIFIGMCIIYGTFSKISRRL